MLSLIKVGKKTRKDSEIKSRFRRNWPFLSAFGELGKEVVFKKFWNVSNFMTCPIHCEI